MPTNPLILRIGCWNVNSLRVRWDLLASWLISERIDMAMLQETKLTDDVFPTKAFQELGYYTASWGQKSYNGVAILSRWPISDVQRCDLNGTSSARYIQGMTHQVRLASVYVPQGQGFDQPAFGEKLRFLQGLGKHMASCVMDPIPTLIGGDYNIAPADEDVWDPALWRNRVMCSVPERQALKRILWSGWSTADLTVKGKTNPHTWWAYQHGAWPKKHGLRIDYFLASPWAADRIAQTGVSALWRDEPQPSDHAPIWLDLRAP